MKEIKKLDCLNREKIGLHFLEKIVFPDNISQENITFILSKIKAFFKLLFKSKKKFNRPFAIQTLEINPNLTQKFYYDRVKKTFSFQLNILTNNSAFFQSQEELKLELLNLRKNLKFYLLDFGGTITQSGSVGRGFQSDSKLSSLFDLLLQELTPQDFFSFFRYEPNQFRFEKELKEKIIYSKMLKSSHDSSNLTDLKMYLFFSRLIKFMKKIETDLSSCQWPQQITIPLILSHGTDTVERTSNYLHYLFTLLKKGFSIKSENNTLNLFSSGIDFKIIFVTAHTPPFLPQSDAYDNLKDAIFFAAQLINQARLPHYINSVLISGGKIISFFSKGLTEISFKSDSIFYSPFPYLAYQKTRKLSWGIEKKFFQLKTIPQEFEVNAQNIPEIDTIIGSNQKTITIPHFFTYLETHHTDFLTQEYLKMILERLKEFKNSYRKPALLLIGELKKKEALTIKEFLKNNFYLPIFLLSPTKKVKKWLLNEINQKKLFLLEGASNSPSFPDKIRFFTSFLPHFPLETIKNLINLPLGDENFTFGKERKKSKNDNYVPLKTFPLIYLKASQNMKSQAIKDGIYFLIKHFPQQPKTIVYEGYGDGHLPLEQINWQETLKNYFSYYYKIELQTEINNIFQFYFYLLNNYHFSPFQLKTIFQTILASSFPKMNMIRKAQLLGIRQLMLAKPKMAWATLEKYAIGQLLLFMGIESPGKGFFNNKLFFEQLKKVYTTKFSFLCENTTEKKLLTYFFQVFPIRFLLETSGKKLLEVYKNFYLKKEIPSLKWEFQEMEINFSRKFQFYSLKEITNFFKYLEIVKSYYNVQKVKIGYNKNERNLFNDLDLPYFDGENYYPDKFSFLRQRNDPFEKRTITITGKKEKFLVET